MLQSLKHIPFTTFYSSIYCPHETHEPDMCLSVCGTNTLTAALIHRITDQAVYIHLAGCCLDSATGKPLTQG